MATTQAKTKNHQQHRTLSQHQQWHYKDHHRGFLITDRGLSVHYSKSPLIIERLLLNFSLHTTHLDLSTGQKPCEYTHLRDIQTPFLYQLWEASYMNRNMTTQCCMNDELAWMTNLHAIVRVSKIFTDLRTHSSISVWLQQTTDSLFQEQGGHGVYHQHFAPHA